MRGKQAPKRKIASDPRYGNIAVAKFINYIMRRGKKSIAEKIVYDAFDIITKKEKQEALDVFDVAVKNVSPAIEVRGKRIGGANYQIPVAVRGTRQQALAFRWIIGAAKSRKGKPMAYKLASELIDAFHEEGSAMKKKNDVRKMAEANRAFAHFAKSF